LSINHLIGHGALIFILAPGTRALPPVHSLVHSRVMIRVSQ
jgi:hypothetical protein